MSMAFYGPVTCKYDDYPEIVIVMNLFEGPELVSIIGFPWGPEILYLIWTLVYLGGTVPMPMTLCFSLYT